MTPLVSVNPLALDFGKVKINSTSEARTIAIAAGSAAELTVESITARDGSLPGGAAAFIVENIPKSVGSFDSAQVTVTFKPTELLGYEAILSVKTNDPDNPVIEVLLNGEGAVPKFVVTPECNAAMDCKGSAVLEPPSLDFGEEPLQRLQPIPTQELPHVRVGNEGDVELLVSMPGDAANIVVQGRDAAAFKIEGNTALPDVNEAGKPAIKIAAGTGPILYIRFVPTSASQIVYDQASLVLLSDDPEKPEVSVALKGSLRPNLPPRVCANIVGVRNGNGSAFDYNTPADWAPLLTPPAGGYDFTESRDVQPSRGSKATSVLFSAHSSSDSKTCTTDPEDGRVMLSYNWEVTEWPAGVGKPLFAQPTSPTPTLLLPTSVKALTGPYTVDLTVKDVQGNTVTTKLKFRALLKEDLVVQLAWPGFAQTDLDLHLIRPSSTDVGTFSGAFSFFNGPGGTLPGGGTAGNTTAGDINGLSFSTRGNYPQANFDWGQNGAFDNPVLNVDDTGSGILVEDISLNYPENDVSCATVECRYKVMVHYFKDARIVGTPPPCSVGGACSDGQRCDCGGDGGMRCVANSQTSPTMAATGTGRCLSAPKPTVRVFVKANPTPAAVIPLDTLNPADDVAMGAPCQMLYVADVVWPAKSSLDGGVAPDGGTGVRIEVKGQTGNRVTNPVFSRFGMRNTGLECAGNTTVGGATTWYGEGN